MKQVTDAFQGTSNTDPEVHCRRKDGSEFWASVFINPVRDKNSVLVQKETPRLCRGGSRSLTNPDVHP